MREPVGAPGLTASADGLGTPRDLDIFWPPIRTPRELV